MPRGRKKANVTEAQTAPIESKARSRKPYPSKEERVAMADKHVARLAALIEQRKALVEKTEGLLNQRRSALASAEEQLEKTKRRKERLLRPEAKKDNKTKVDELFAALAASGKSVDDLLAELKGENPEE